MPMSSSVKSASAEQLQAEEPSQPPSNRNSGQRVDGLRSWRRRRTVAGPPPDVFLSMTAVFCQPAAACRGSLSGNGVGAAGAADAAAGHEGG